MRVHHLNCISTCPLGGRLIDGFSRGVRGQLANHCLLVEAADGLVLVDTGFGLNDVANPRQRLSKFFLQLLEPDFREEMTAVRQIEALGYSATDVRRIVLTHLDFDHAGGLDDFPEATVHMLIEEGEDAVKQRSWLDRQRFRPQQWSSHPRWHGHQASGEPWFGFEAVRDIPGVGPDLLMIPLIGHTLGHAGVAVRDDRGWLFLAGDAYFDQDELDIENPRCTPGLRAYQWMMEKDRHLRLANQERLRELVRGHGDEVRIMCSHDPRELEAATGKSINARASAHATSEGARSAWHQG
jgi:glyoxylase-like metal-dependent hydrolase (beta-lactamase superfamily II)